MKHSGGRAQLSAGGKPTDRPSVEEARGLRHANEAGVWEQHRVLEQYTHEENARGLDR
jgi:hypothetical protein